MAKNTVILSLTQPERDALALCGITQDDQLARTGPRALLRELETAARFFPDTLKFTPEYARLEAICKQAAGNTQLPEEEAGTWNDITEVSQPEGNGMALPEVSTRRHYSRATGRVLMDEDVKKAQSLDDNHKKDDPRGFNHSICCAHPIATYLSAWATWALAFAVLTLGLCVVGLLIGIKFAGTMGIILAVVLVSIVITYAILLKMATCATCRVPIFSFRRYPRNRKAHYIPLLGYTLATALSVIFCFRYRCPSCGTPQKLFGKHRHTGRRNNRRKR